MTRGTFTEITIWLAAWTGILTYYLHEEGVPGDRIWRMFLYTFFALVVLAAIATIFAAVISARISREGERTDREYAELARAYKDYSADNVRELRKAHPPMDPYPFSRRKEDENDPVA